MRTLRIAAIALLAVAGSPAQPGKPQDPKKLPDPKVKEELKKLDTLVRMKGAQDAEAVAVIQELSGLTRDGVEADRKSFAAGLDKVLKAARKPEEVTLHTAAIEALAGLGELGAKSLLKAVQAKEFRKKESLAFRAEIVRSLGRTEDPSAVKPLLDLLKDKDDPIIAAAVDGLKYYAESDEKIRKEIVERLVILFNTTTDSAASTDPGDMMAQTFKQRLSLISGPCNNTLQALTGQNLDIALEWGKWWNNNKGKKWPAPKKEGEDQKGQDEKEK